MRNALRTLLALILAFVVATAVIMLVDTANGRFIYPELGKAGEGVTDREVVRQVLAMAPIGAFPVVLAGSALAIGVIIALAGVANNLMIPPPAWFWAAGPLVPLAAGALTARLQRAKKSLPE